jgi:hypothetical protein
MQRRKLNDHDGKTQENRNYSHSRRDVAMKPAWPLWILLDIRDKPEATKVFSVQTDPCDSDT